MNKLQLLTYLKERSFFDLKIESIVETFELYNYQTRAYGQVKFEDELFHEFTEKTSFMLRIELFDEGPKDSVNGQCIFFDPLAEQQLVIFLELGEKERDRLVGLVKSTLEKKISPKLRLEVAMNEAMDLDDKNSLYKLVDSGISLEVMNIRIDCETGKKRNYFD